MTENTTEHLPYLSQQLW